MKWLNNIVDPRKNVFENKDSFWPKGTVLGRPQTTTKCTVEELEKFDMVGVYLPDDFGIDFNSFK